MDDDVKRLTLWRALRAAEFWALIVTAVAGMAGGAWWVFIPLCVLALAISSLPKYWQLWPRAVNAGAERVWFGTVALSLLNSSGTACAAFVLGAFTAWLWGL